MGIGFKAVFKLSGSPAVICGHYRFGFSASDSDADDWGWILVPKWLDELPPHADAVLDAETIYWLPYKEDLAKPVRTRVADSLIERFDSHCLLFLRNVREIRIEHPETSRRLTRVKGTVAEERNGQAEAHCYKIVAQTFEVPPEVKGEYRVQESRRDTARIRELSLVFGLNDEGGLRKTQDPPLYVFLPTSYQTELRFAVQGDFILDAQRSRVDEGLQWNRWLWRCTGKLLQDAVEQFKADARWRCQFYRILPTRGDFPSSRSDLDIVRAEMVEPFREYCKGGQIVLSSAGLWVRPLEAVWVSQEMQDLLDPVKLQALSGREHAVHSEIKEGKTFLEEMGVTELKDQQVLEALKDIRWTQDHDADWFCSLYAFLWEKWDGWRPHHKAVMALPIVRTHHKTVQTPDQVLFPPDQEEDGRLAEGIPGATFVDRKVLPGRGRELLEKLGVHAFSHEGLIKSTILHGFESDEWRSWTSEGLERCRNFIKAWLQEHDWSAKPDTERRLGAVRVPTEAGTLERADKCYFPDPQLRTLYPEGPFVQASGASEEERPFLNALGVKDRPRVLLTEGPHDLWGGKGPSPYWEKYRSWLLNTESLEYGTGRRLISKFMSFEGWHDFRWSHDLGKTALNYLVRNWATEYASHRSCDYTYFYYNKHEVSVLAWQQGLPIREALIPRLSRSSVRPCRTKNA